MSTHIKSVAALAAAGLLPRVGMAMTHPTVAMIIVLVVLLLSASPVFAHSSQG